MDKTCIDCAKTKTIEEFSRDKSRRDGRKECCRTCAAIRRKRQPPTSCKYPAPLGMKHCPTCGIVKPLDQFFRNASYADGHGVQCKICHAAPIKRRREQDPEGERRKATERSRIWRRKNPGYDRKANLRAKYGLSPNDYARMLAAQDGRCEICGSTEAGRGRKNLCVDHDEITGRIRGLLCVRCNTGIGSLLHSAEILTNAIKYIHKYNGLSKGAGR